MPYGARVWINGAQGGWYQVIFNGIQGFASGRYISTQVASGPQPPFYGQRPPVYGPQPPFYGPMPPVMYRPPPPTWGYYQQPWWDNRHNAWYDGRRWFSSGQWYATPNFSIGFSFRG